ncbi:phytanoyl-CoA dioxygenase family protein [Gammaproteobacteria bacterium]|nr:phytanoyl-CoA dioxygenase family protein [Gammaproteobacteria bacterium]
MLLSEKQMRRYQDQGYILLPEYLDHEEVCVLRAEAEALFKQKRNEISTEPGGAARTAFAPHFYSDVYAALVRHPRLVSPAFQLLEEQAYLNQVKMHALPAFAGVGFNWHQDYGTAWKLVDGMSSDRALSVAVFIDEVRTTNSPVMVIPGSHKYGDIKAVENTASDRPRFVPDRTVVAKLANDRGIELCSGAAGSVLIFHANLVHGSSNNITPWHRKSIYISYAALSNKSSPAAHRKPWIALRDYNPVAALDVDCLRQFVAG